MRPLALITALSALLLFSAGAGASPDASVKLSPFASAEPDLLEPQQAFTISPEVRDKTVTLHFDTHTGYTQYREAFNWRAEPREGIVFTASPLPGGHKKFDPFFKRDVEYYRERVSVHLQFAKAPATFELIVQHRGCADAGVCYPALQWRARISLKAFGAPRDEVQPLTHAISFDEEPAQGAENATAVSATPAVSTAESSPSFLGAALATDEAGLARLLGERGNLLLTVLLFLLIGLLLSITPCVLPMLPILSAFLFSSGAQSGAGERRPARGVRQAASYSLGMIAAYTLLGVAAGLAGEGLGIWLQAPWLRGSFALLVLLLALSMIGFLRLPALSALQTRANLWAQRLQDRPGQQWVALFVLGALSVLVAGPCVAAPLSGVLLYISRSGDAALGALALFSMALGMSAPLWVLGLTAGRLRLRPGAWMAAIEKLFGVLLLALAFWMLDFLLPLRLLVALWSALPLAYSLWLWRASASWRRRSLWRTVAVLGVAWSVVECISLVSGGRSFLRPLAHWGQQDSEPLPFVAVRDDAALQAQISNAAQMQRPLLLDFYADWCITCQEIEHFTLTDASLRAELAHWHLARVDVTANSAAQRELMRRFRIFGPPAMILFDALGQERARLIGVVDARQLQAQLQTLRLGAALPTLR